MKEVIEINQNINEINSTNPEDVEAINVLVKEIVKAVRGNVVNCDRTFKTAIKKVTPKGYVILDESGSERCVGCCIPDLKLRIGQAVYVKMIQGKVKDMHICGIA